MQVTVENPMSIEWALRARRRCGATRDVDALTLYRERHSVIYTVMFWIDIEGISNRVHSHIVRSHVGFIPFVRTQRPDRRGVDGLRDMSILCNAEALIVLAQKRLCQQAWPETREVVQEIKEKVAEIDSALAAVMQPRCVWEGRCRQARPCGWYQGQKLAGDR